MKTRSGTTLATASPRTLRSIRKVSRESKSNGKDENSFHDSRSNGSLVQMQQTPTSASRSTAKWVSTVKRSSTTGTTSSFATVSTVVVPPDSKMFQNVVHSPIPNVTNLQPIANVFESPVLKESSFLSNVNDTFLEAVELMEKDCYTKANKTCDTFRNDEDVFLENSQDMFSDMLEQDVIDMIPASQLEIDPMRTPKHAEILSSHRRTNTGASKRRKSSTSSKIPVKAVQDKPQANKKPAVSKPEKKKKKKQSSTFKVAYTNRKATKLLSESENTQLSTREDLSFMSEEEKLLLTSWGLPSTIIARYRAKKVTSLFPWQLDCLSNPKVLQGSNLLYSAPTSAGKTLVAEILMIKRVLELGKKAIMILPFVSVAREKMFSLQELFGDAGIRVEGFMGSYNPPGGFKSVDIAICTIEKANSLINRLLEDGSLSQLGTVVVDELHLLGDPNRGYLLELLLTKLRFMTFKNVELLRLSEQQNLSLEDENEKIKKLNIQIIGMSATLPNLPLLADWLKAELVITDFRPVPLVERIKISDKLYDESLQPVRDVEIESLPLIIADDDNDVVYLSLETILGGHSVLIFCPTKNLCEKTALRIAEQFFHIGSPLSKGAPPEISESLRNQLSGQKLSGILAQLDQSPGGLEDILKKTVAFGVAFHHAGLSFEERDILEAGFKSGVLRVMVATSTLSAGVNLPARRVIITTPIVFNGHIMDILTYRQMSGRAGRKGVDTEGESILLCNEATKRKGITLIQSHLPAVESALLDRDGTLTSSMKRALLEVIASGVATTPQAVHEYAQCTLLALNKRQESKVSQKLEDSTIKDCIQFLQDGDFIMWKTYENQEKDHEFMATNLGAACLASSLSPDEGVLVYKELQKARQCFVLDNDLHVIYQVTPIYLADQWRNVDWNLYLQLWEELNDSEKKVATLVGVRENFIIHAMTGVASWRNPMQRSILEVHQRFYTALALNDLVNEVPIGIVAQKYNVSKGVIQNLQQSASTFAGMVTAFCGRLGWSNLELLLSQFQDRLQFGVQRELCDLVRLSLLNGQLARMLYDGGIKNIAELSVSEPAQVAAVFHRGRSFTSSVHGGNSRTLWILGKNEIFSEHEAASMIVQEARQFIQFELGLPQEVNDVWGMPTFFKNQNTSNHRVDLIDDGSKTDLLGSGSDSDKAENDSDDNICTNSSSDSESEQPAASVHDEKPKNGDEDSDSTQFESSLTEDEHVLAKTGTGKSDSSWNKIMNIFSDSSKSTKAEHNNSIEIENPFSSHSFLNTDELSKLEKEYEDFPYQIQNNQLANENVRRNVCLDDVSNAIENQLVAQMEQSMEISQSSNRNRIENSQVKHSTPVTASQRLLQDVFESSQRMEITKNESNCVGNEFDSVAELMEMSLSVSNEESKSKSIHDGIEPAGSLIMSESMNAAMKDVAENSYFASEDMFASEPMNESATDMNKTSSSDEILEKSLTPPESVRTPGSARTKARRQLSFMNNGYATERSNNSSMFGSNGNSSASSKCVSFLSAMLNGNRIHVKKIVNSKSLPTELLSDTPIGIGLKFTPKARLNIGRIGGIGAKIIRGNFASHLDKLSRINEDIREHTITLFNGGDTIWTFNWLHQSEHRSRSIHRTLFDHAQPKGKVSEILQALRNRKCSIVLMDAKEQQKKLLKYCGRDILDVLPPVNQIWDPRVAQWLLEFDEENYNLFSDKLIHMHLREENNVSEFGWNPEIVDAFISWKLMMTLKNKLEKVNLWTHFTEIEMPSTRPVMLMEINGFKLDSSELERLKKILQFKLALLEIKAFHMAGRQFNLSSPKEISNILFREIGLKRPNNTSGTKKDVLLKLNHGLPKVIIEWRKINSALQTVVVPFQQERNIETGRIHGNYCYFTVTGRVIMSEPSLQTIPRDFDLQLSFTRPEVEAIKNSGSIKFGSKLSNLFTKIEAGLREDSECFENCKSISMRNAFVKSSSEFALVSADYCQLELRVLAHLSNDKTLMDVLNDDEVDVFIAIAAQLKNSSLDMVTDEMRQQAKRIVYGIIYGIGAKTLSEQMEVDETEASQFISQFMRKFSGVKIFMEKTVKLCRNLGYIETISGRRRYLPNITSDNPVDRAKGERQAMNSKIQGSASDLVKCAMVKIQQRIQKMFPSASLPIDWKNSGEHTMPMDVIAFPILNLHDELIFEVRISHLQAIAKIIRSGMEDSSKLRVRLPVVVKTGASWSSLTPYAT